MAETLVSIIVPTLGRPDLLARCLDSIAASVHLPHEVLCVTVADDDASREVVEAHGAVNITQAERGGYVQAANLGLEAARGEYITILNDDCELLPHTIANAIRFMEAPAHRETVGQAAFFHDTQMRRNIHQQIRIEDTWYFTCHVRGLCYANFGLARRSLYEQLDWLDERYFMYGSDPDFSLKVWHEAKLAVAPCPGALMHHAQLEDERARAERGRQDEDNHKLFEKWGLG